MKRGNQSIRPEQMLWSLVRWLYLVGDYDIEGCVSKFLIVKLTFLFGTLGMASREEVIVGVIRNVCGPRVSQRTHQLFLLLVPAGR